MQGHHGMGSARGQQPPLEPPWGSGLRRAARCVPCLCGSFLIMGYNDVSGQWGPAHQSPSQWIGPQDVATASCLEVAACGPFCCLALPLPTTCRHAGVLACVLCADSVELRTAHARLQRYHTPECRHVHCELHPLSNHEAVLALGGDHSAGSCRCSALIWHVALSCDLACCLLCVLIARCVVGSGAMHDASAALHSGLDPGPRARCAQGRPSLCVLSVPSLCMVSSSLGILGTSLVFGHQHMC